MAETPPTVKLTLELTTEELEPIIQQAFAAGYAHGIVQADQEPGTRLAVTQAYEDWRGAPMPVPEPSREDVKADLFASPEGLTKSPRGIWPASADQRMDCGHDVVYGDPIGYIAAGRGCEDCVTDEWDAEDRMSRPHGYWGQD